jgi:hypothetical protein
LLLVPEKKNFFQTFLTLQMGKKIISKNHLTPAPTSFSFEDLLKNQQKSGNDFRKV